MWEENKLWEEWGQQHPLEEHQIVGHTSWQWKNKNKQKAERDWGRPGESSVKEATETISKTSTTVHTLQYCTVAYLAPPLDYVFFEGKNYLFLHFT